ncbi:hypothetical protein [Priestia megaterium]|uniref:hypothetical protein n=1 Tax=Priestia megaterium TaxID=1404 RepID=UPI002877884C|nr:hypothetical protein [Priestia megaterium]
MKLIHRYDNKSKLWFSELVNQEGTVLHKEKSSSEKEYKLDQTIKLGFKEYRIIDYDYNMYSAIRLVVKLMEVE